MTDISKKNQKTYKNQNDVPERQSRLKWRNTPGCALVLSSLGYWHRRTPGSNPAQTSGGLVRVCLRTERAADTVYYKGLGFHHSRISQVSDSTPGHWICSGSTENRAEEGYGWLRGLVHMSTTFMGLLAPQKYVNHKPSESTCLVCIVLHISTTSQKHWRY